MAQSGSLNMVLISQISINEIYCIIIAIMLKYLILAIALLSHQAHQACDPPFSEISVSSGSTCVKCDTTCLTCFSSTMGSCTTCPLDFTFDDRTSYCHPPDNQTVHTIESSYKYYGFTEFPGWSGGTVDSSCSYTSIYGGGSSTTLTTTHTLGSHYKLRVLVAAFWLSSSNSPITLSFSTSTPTTRTLSPAPQQENSTYCDESLANNLDTSFSSNSQSSITVTITSASASWGIREYVFIEYLCNSTWCATCNGPEWNQCLTCASANRVPYSGQCRCNPSTSYFKHPDYEHCVKPCPSRPSTGQWYGDPSTQLCVQTCPDDAAAHFLITFADDNDAKCKQICPASFTTGSETKAYYHDLTNRRCVTTCPSTEPYKHDDGTYKYCVSLCPTGYYKYDQEMTCVTSCSTSNVIPLFKDDLLGKCVDDCEGVDWWADPLTGQCTDVCSGTDYFEDNTTSRNRCTEVCPAPVYFGDTSRKKCLDHCDPDDFGDTLPTSKRHCVPLCSGGYFGLLTGNRACVQTCPAGTWAEHTTYTCALTPNNCQTDTFADNKTRSCVAKGACSQGLFSSDASRMCVFTCPDGKYADQQTGHCETGCSGTYFADPGVNKCLEVCYTDGLFSDVSSGNMCVERCNQSGLTPFRDASTKACVDVCPDDPYLFADPDAERCVFNCSLGLYQDDLTDSTNKVCVDFCPSPYWGANNTGYGECVVKCSEDPPLFGATVVGYRICVSVCQSPLFGDQDPANGRQCISTCPLNYFAQADDLRRCVARCNSTTYGHDKVCYFPKLCPNGWVGDPDTALCTNLCSQTRDLYADKIITNLCVEKCPIDNEVIYFADPTNRQCVDTCDSGNDLYGNNNTQTCKPKCLDPESFADAQNVNRFCIKVCTNTVAKFYYRNRHTKVCVTSMNCPASYYGDNTTEDCVGRCPAPSWAHKSTKTCVQKCYGPLWGDDSSGNRVCVAVCPAHPPRWSYDTDMVCVDRCPESESLYGEDFTRTCVPSCPGNPGGPDYTYAYDGTRRCLESCPQGTFSDYQASVCWPFPENCTDGWGDDFNNSCTTLCTGPDPWNSFGDNLTHLCTIRCSEGSYADEYTGTRICVAICPGNYDLEGTVDGAYDSFGDNSTQSCVLQCVTPSTWADWQTHRCETQCSGEDPASIPTYSENRDRRCVLALACPETPDKLYGDNNTRACVTSCLSSGGNYEWADNVTRTCIPQCINWADSPGSGSITTRFYGDVSTDDPICVISCPESPRLFGENSTNRCVSECPDNQYGDQTGNRSCVDFCPTFPTQVWFTQITNHICVLMCEEGTWGNYHGRPHCETVPTDCIAGEFADNSTNLCVPLCPQDQNYFGDPSTKLCVPRCPKLDNQVVNSSANINMASGYLYADYSTRLCVYKCPDDIGPRGTFGDNLTNTCVQRCPPGSFGDPQTTHRHCVSVCTAGTYADHLSMTCTGECPASPPHFASDANWTCVHSCPQGTWADSSTRRCESTCPVGQYKLQSQNECIDVCPSSPDLYGDPDNHECVLSCINATSKQFSNPFSRLCVDSCSPDFEYQLRCVRICPDGYYGNSAHRCVEVSLCDGDTFGDNATRQCVSSCLRGFADSNSRYCIAVCPEGWYGEGNTCVQNCQASSSASNITQLCTSTCPHYTYEENGTCTSRCTFNYANDDSHKCESSCPANFYGHPLTHDCVVSCHDNLTNGDYFRDTANGLCVNDCSPKFKDFITGNCEDRCSEGYWGYTGNFSCLPECISGEYGFQSATQRTCYAPANLPPPANNLFGDPESGEYVAVCPIAPKLYFGDSSLHECVESCPQHGSTTFYGDPSTRQCQSACQNSAYTADPRTGNCEIRCSVNTFRDRLVAICVSGCSSGYADNTTSRCVNICPQHDDTFGYFNQTSGYGICVDQCPSELWAEPTSRVCDSACPSPLFAYNATQQCVEYCVDSFADAHNRKCMDACTSTLYPWADNSTNECVNKCPSDPDYYGDSHVCVFYCTTPTYYADPASRECVPRCPDLTYISYGDPLTGRCVRTCPLGYYGDNSTNLCKKNCPTSSFAYNETRTCLIKCPKNENLYGDPLLHACASTCSGTNFGSQISQECIPKCEDTYWGDPLTTLCVQACPVQIYSYGENSTRICVKSCLTGFADNYTRLCREFCHETRDPQTYRDHSAKACVEMCPEGFFMENDTNECLASCTSGYADNYSRYCVSICPDNPETYGEDHHQTCVYECTSGEFSDNSTNKCVEKCPTNPDFFGDPHTGRCVFWCTEGSWAESTTRQCLSECLDNTYADNLTRTCVPDCPSTQNTYADDASHRCVRVCPAGFWADNSTLKCVDQCPVLNSGSIQTYADNVTEFCVQECPDPFFGLNQTHECVSQCPASQTLFGHPQGRVCVGRLQCFEVNSTLYFADDTTRTCVEKCPLNRWADLNEKVCKQTCPSGYYRNNNDQTCVSNCPTDPDEYIDPDSLNCTRKCPNGRYAVVGGNGLRICDTICSTHSLIIDNVTNRCVGINECPTEPFMYGDALAYKCVFYCSQNHFRDNKTQTCQQTCPADWQLFGDLETYECVPRCRNYKFADTTASRTCQIQCTNGYFADNLTSKCVERCSHVKPYYYEDVPSKSCVEYCPGESYALDSNQTCVYTQNGVSQCPAPFFADRSSHKCVQKCPNGSYATISTRYCEQTCTGDEYADDFQWECVSTCPDHTFALNDDPLDQKCMQFCPDAYYAQNSTKSCVTSCNSLLALISTHSCENYCPEPYFADWDNNKCVPDCSPKYADSVARECVTPCSAPSWSNPINHKCELLCPENNFGRPGSRICEQSCLNGTYADPTLRLCVTQCAVSPMLFADDRTNECVPECTSPLFAYTVTRTCVSDCPTTNGLVYLADESNWKCVLECVNQEISYADYANNQCTDFCPLGKFASNSTKECVDTCPTVPVNTFADAITRICVAVCYNGFGDSDLLQCVPSCSLPKYADPSTRLCVSFCPSPSFAQDEDARCKQSCSSNKYADPSTHRCVNECPAVQSLFKYDQNWTCVQDCPAPYYADENLRKCVLICDSTNGLYAYQLTNECVLECPTPYRGFQPNHTCILNCPTSYFYNNTKNLCTQCPLECLTCVGPYSCMSCQNGYNLFNGVCSYSCNPQNNVITYAHPTNNQCVQQCPPQFFGENQTYTCTQNCPAKQYGESTTRLCEECPSTCAICSNLTYCSACESYATLAIDNMCYSDCNSTHRYFYETQCYSHCPSGTFISYTNVHCQECADLCDTCEGESSNCTNCHDRYFYNNTCLTKCPGGYYGDSSLMCVPCPTDSTVCEETLSFKATIQLQNFQYVMLLEFNQEVELRKPIDEFLEVQLQIGRRRVLDLADLINNGVKFTYIILSNGIIKLYLDIDTDLKDPVLIARFTDPTAIVSRVTGGTLQDTDASVYIQEIEYYPKSEGEQIGIRKAALFAIVFLLLLYALSIVVTDTMIKVIQFMQILFFHCVVAAPIPASLFFFLRELKPSLLQFLPNFMAEPLPKDVTLYASATRRTIDVFVDYNFFRNVGQIVFVMILYFILWGVFLVLSNRRVIEHKIWHNFLLMISVRRLRMSIINDIGSVFYLPILWFGFSQFQELFSAGYLGFNGFITLVLVLMALALPFAWLYVWWKKQYQQIQEHYPFMTNRIDTSRQKTLLETPISYFYIFFCALWFVSLNSVPTAQMVMLILTNLAYLVYMGIFKPFRIHINTIMVCALLLILIILEIFIIYFEEADADLSSSQKLAVIFPMLIVISVVLMLTVLWSVWRCVWQFQDTWAFFKTTEFYQAYGDPAQPSEKSESEHFDQYEKIIVNQQPQVGDVILDQINKQCNQEGESVIKVRKKVLRKKKKVKGRAKILQAHEQENEEKEYVRINRVNPFDYDYDEDYHVKQKKQLNKRKFDDDVRDRVSSDEQPEEELKDRKKANKRQQQSPHNHNIVKVEPNEKPLTGLGDFEELDEAAESVDNTSQQPSEKNGWFLGAEQEPEDSEPNISKHSENDKQLPDKLSPRGPATSPRQQAAIQEAEDDEIYPESGSEGSRRAEEEPEDVVGEELKEQKAKQKHNLNSQENEEKPKIQGIEELLREQEGKEKKNLIFMFDDFEEDNE